MTSIKLVPGGKKLCNRRLNLFKVDSATVVIGGDWKLMCGKVHSNPSSDIVILSKCSLCDFACRIGHYVLFCSLFVSDDICF